MRQYYYERRPAWGGFSSGKMVNKIVLVNVIVFILEYIFEPQFTRLFALSPWMMLEQFYFWQVVTYMFLHFGVWHLLFNMFIIWMFGSALEQVWGSNRFLKYYLGCGLGGALFSFIFAYNNITLGASAAGFGLLLAYAMLFPNNLIYIWFLFPVKAKYLVIFLAVFQLLQGISGHTGIAYFAHLGGLAAGLLFFRREIMYSRLFSQTRRQWKRYSQGKQSDWEKHEKAKVDSILEKIASKGYEDLSTTEKRILENYSRKRKGESD